MLWRGSQSAGAFALVLALVLSTTAWAEGRSPEGRWRTFDDATGAAKSIVSIRIINNQAEAIVERVFAPPAAEERPICTGCPGEFAARPVIGMRIMWGLKQKGEEWVDGRVFDPEARKIYRCKLRVIDDGRKLELRGFIGFSLIGRSQTWSRE
jgi:uncharacterized protein (DUF2147 family)